MVTAFPVPRTTRKAQVSESEGGAAMRVARGPDSDRRTRSIPMISIRVFPGPEYSPDARRISSPDAAASTASCMVEYSLGTRKVEAVAGPDRPTTRSAHAIYFTDNSYLRTMSSWRHDGLRDLQALPSIPHSIRYSRSCPLAKPHNQKVPRPSIKAGGRSGRGSVRSSKLHG